MMIPIIYNPCTFHLDVTFNIVTNEKNPGACCLLFDFSHKHNRRQTPARGVAGRRLIASLGSVKRGKDQRANQLSHKKGHKSVHGGGFHALAVEHPDLRKHDRHMMVHSERFHEFMNLCAYFLEDG